MKRYIVLSALFLLVALVAVPAHATLLSPNGSATPPAATGGIGSGSAHDTTLTNAPKYPGGCATDTINDGAGLNPLVAGLGNSFGSGSGQIVADTCVIQANAYLHGAYLTLDFREVIYKEAGGTLDFYMQAAVVGTPVAGTQLTDMFQLPFSGVTMNVQTASGVNLLGLSPSTPSSPAGQNDDPTKVWSGNSGAGKGSTQTSCAAAGAGCITWVFNGSGFTGLGLNGVTLTMEMQTNATSFIQGGIGFDTNVPGVGMDPVLAFAPVAPVPEPVSIILMGTVLAVGAFFIRRRRTAKNDLSVS